MGSIVLFSLFLFQVLVRSQPLSDWNVTSSIPEPRNGQSIGISFRNDIFLFGGKDNQNAPKNDIFVYRNNISQWKTMSITTPTTWFYSETQSSVTIDGIIYFIGVQDTSYSGKTYLFDTTKEVFIDNSFFPIMPTPLIYGCVATDYNEFIFVVGGIYLHNNGWEHPNILQIYSVQNNSWEAIPNLPINGWYNQMCVVFHNILYVFGGFDFEHGIYQNAIFEFNIPTKEWNQNANYLSMARSSGNAVMNEIDTCIYVIGGWNNENRGPQKAVDIFYPTRNHSIIGPDLQIEIAALTSALIDNELMTFGGGNEFTNVINYIQTSTVLT